MASLAQLQAASVSQMLVVGNCSQQPLVFGGVSQIESRPNVVPIYSFSNEFSPAGIYVFFDHCTTCLTTMIAFLKVCIPKFCFHGSAKGIRHFCTFCSLKSMQYSWTSHPQGSSWSVCEAERVRCNSNATPRALVASAGTTSEAGREAGENNAKSE